MNTTTIERPKAVRYSVESVPILAHDILKLLPHRYPFLLVDRVISFTPNAELVAIKNVTMNEPFFTGHFPGTPIMPGVLIVEAMAQACGLLSSLSTPTAEGNHLAFLFAGIDNVRFKQVVIPGDQLRFEVLITARKNTIWKLNAKTFVEEKLVCSGDLTCSVQEVEND